MPRTPLLLVPLCAVPLLVGCTPAPVGSEEVAAEPAAAVRALNARGEPHVAATRPDADTLVITTWGSSSCPTRPVRIERRSPSAVEVRVRPTDRQEACTADHSPLSREVRLPEGVSASAPLEVVFDDGREDEDTWPRVTVPPPGA